MSARATGGAALALVLAGLAAGALAAGPAAAPAGERDWRVVRAPYAFTFPRDHAAHPAFRTEWWYYTGHLRSGGRAFGYQLTFFRVGLDRARAASPSAWAPHSVLFAHAALTDERGRRFTFDERIARPALGLAGADTARYRVWIGEWSAALARDGTTHTLRATVGDASLALDATPLKPPAVHGRGGVSVKAAGAGHASHYYSLTRMRTRGRLVLAGDTLEVDGTSWMDHEFMTTSLAPDQVGWDWFSISLEDGRELMLYRLRRTDGTDEPASSGTLVARDGRVRHLPRAAWALAEHGVWTSPRGGRYPAAWTIRVPDEGLELRLAPVLADQELSTAATGIVYWEGAVRVTGSARGVPVRGQGYAELTGYAGPPPGPPRAPGS